MGTKLFSTHVSTNSVRMKKQGTNGERNEIASKNLDKIKFKGSAGIKAEIKQTQALITSGFSRYAGEPFHFASHSRLI